MNNTRKPRSLPQLAAACSWLLRFLALTAAFVAAGALRVSGALARGPSEQILFIVAGLLACALVVPAAIRLWRRIRQTRQGADAFMDAMSRAHARAHFAEDRAMLLEGERDALREERNRLLKRNLSNEPDPD
ncbi:MAG: hypothetical protein AAB562_02245 [Patescibacteria group bacterium]